MKLNERNTKKQSVDASMTVNPIIQETIAAKVLAEQVEKEPSGRLSASRLGWPLQWMMLHYHKVPQQKPDEYTLRKFVRGKDVEDRIMNWLAPKQEQTQVPVAYRGVAGFADVVLDYPIEVKSITNLAFKYKQKEGASRSHRLQGELYSKALGFSKYGVAYVASDDYRVLCFEYEISDEADKVIDEYEEQLKSGVVPVFEPKESWQKLEKYSIYPEWRDLNEEEIAAKLQSYQISK